MKKSRNYKKLTKQLPDLEEQIKQGHLKVIPLPKYSKNPIIPKWNTQEYSLTESFTYTNKGEEYTQKGLKYHNGNYGLLIGYNNSKNGYSIGCIDIDGYKTDKKNPDVDIKNETKKLIYDALKDIPNSIQVKTQSGGYHIYLWTKKTQPDSSKTSNSLYFPQDFPIKELAGQCLNNSIEVFTNEDKTQVVLPTSTIDSKDKIKETGLTLVNTYKVISTLNTFADMEIVDDLNQTIIDHLTSKGYGYKLESNTPITNKANNSKKSKPKNSTDNNLRELNKTQIKEVTDLVTPIFSIIDGEKHTGAMYLGGYFSYHITESSCSEICDRIINQIGNLFDDTDAFKRTVLNNYGRDIQNKGGLPKLSELILQRDKEYNITEFTDKLQGICNSDGDNFKVTKAKPFKLEGKEVPVIIYEDSIDKWTVFSGIFKGIDLELNFNILQGTFIRKSDNEHIISFEFKYNKQLFKVTKDESKSIEYFLDDEGIIVPNHFLNKIRQYLKNSNDNISEKKKLSDEQMLFKLFSNPNVPVRSKRQKLGHYLKEHGVILRRGVNNPYILDKKTNGYNAVDTDDLVEKLDKEVFNNLDLVHSKDAEEALGFIADRRKPVYNIVKFPNCIYDIENFKVIEATEDPVFTLTEVKYKYNPKAKGDQIINFLKSSLKQKGDTEDEIKKRVTGFLEMIGYLLTSGNKLQAFFILSGKGGSGKGVATNLIIEIFGNEKVGGLQLQELTPDNRFATSHLESKQVNIVRDSPKTPIDDTGMLKSITGYDDIPCEHKGKDKSMIPKEEVPDMILVCNNVPKFKNGFEEEVVERVVIFEFLNKFRGTKKQNKNLLKDILAKPEEMEWLIYNGIKAYEKMIQSNEDFKARVNRNKTRELLGKHTDPISFVLPKLVKTTKEDTSHKDPIIAKELNLLIRFLVDKEGMSITDLNEKGKIKPRVLAEKIRSFFEFDANWTTKSEYIKDLGKSTTVYPNLYKTEEYDNILRKMKEKQESEEENK